MNGGDDTNYVFGIRGQWDSLGELSRELLHFLDEIED
jgi:hypothetical protein